MSAIVHRAREQIDEAARRAVERYRSEITDYAASNGTLIDGEVLTVTRRSYAMLCDRLESDAPPPADILDEMRRAFARRVHQDVSLMSIQQACQIGGEIFWGTILAGASPRRARRARGGAARGEHAAQPRQPRRDDRRAG